MHTIGTLYAQSITDDRIYYAAAQRAAHVAARPSSPSRRKLRVSFRRAGRPARSVA
jgi:hypothetical protein